MVGFVVMIFFGHLVVATCNWSVPRATRRELHPNILGKRAISDMSHGLHGSHILKIRLPHSASRTKHASPFRTSKVSSFHGNEEMQVNAS